MIQLVPGFWVNPELVAVVKETGDDECALFTQGQSAVDGGFKLDYSAESVAEAIDEALYGEEEVDEDEQEEE
jgi:hypothetical protein